LNVSAPDTPIDVVVSKKSLPFRARRIQIVSMRIVTEPFLKQTARCHPQAASWVNDFIRTARESGWKNVTEMRRSYPHADLVTVKSGRKVVVLNVAGNKYRLVLACHFNRQIIFTLKFLTHAEYAKPNWKAEL
jgi:mRNA interferase HigB